MPTPPTPKKINGGFPPTPTTSAGSGFPLPLGFVPPQNPNNSNNLLTVTPQQASSNPKVILKTSPVSKLTMPKTYVGQFNVLTGLAVCVKGLFRATCHYN